MRKMILCSHGSMATGTKSALAMIMGENDDVKAYDLDHYTTPVEIREAIEAQINEDLSSEYVIFADVQGGSVFNEVYRLGMTMDKVHVVGGFNLGMLLELGCSMIMEDMDFRELILNAVESAKNSIILIDKQYAEEQSNKKEEDDDLWQ